SRFVDAKEQKRVIEGIGTGQVDIVIGTHRLLSKDVKWKRLGLLVIDEEHRFGVAQKERIKELRTEVDVLTMTATPIPRTLHMALSGVRELSTINTPPPDRLAVRTRVIRFEEGLIRDAILKELRRGGQVFYVHNRVENIEEQADFVRKIVPEARVGVGHGQMTEHMLEKVMTGFLTRKFDVLVSTAIIESGLDIPSANTILVNHADKFGLAQLYQLRGRVGRSSEQAYALFIVHEPEKLPPDAKQRLRVLQEFTELSSGFKVATYDLEIRGAGNMLGKSQSGHISAVGFDLYTELLEQAIQETKGEAPAPTVEPELHVGERAYIPEDYIPDMNQRLLFYKRLSAIEGEEEAVQIRDEMVDRFGPPPEIVERLVGVMRLRMVLKALLIETLTYDRVSVVLGFHAETPVGPEAVIDLIRSDPRKYAMSKDFKLTVRAPDLSWDALAKEVRAVARLLQPKEKPAVKRWPGGDG
ncbi:MAG: transcription-repair coupling factor, partial [Candidatus Methylomirabilis sp.]|nr:transcription-repair coupling factor [Deltaproteobacteria bacterium]